MTLPAKPTNAPTALDLSYVQAMPAATPTEAPSLPGSVLAPLNQVWARIQNAQNAFNALGERHKAIWENAAHPLEHRRTLAAQLLADTFSTVDAELTTAESSLRAAKEAVKAGLTPPLLGAPDVHELKLMNAREEVKTALEGLQPYEQLRALKELFDDSLSDDPRSPIAFFIADTDAYKRLLKDPGTRAAFAVTRLELLKQLLPAFAAAFIEAEPEIQRAADALQMAQTARYFVAKDNGVTAGPLPSN